MHDFEKLPKIELHLHLDSSLRYEAVQRIQPGITLNDFKKRFVAPPKCRNLTDYLARVANQVELLQTDEALRLAAESLIQQLLADNVIYAEVRFAPLLHTRKGLTAGDVLDVVSETINSSTKNSALSAGIIVCSVRSFTEDQSMETVRLAKEFSHRNVVGFDLAGDEKGFPLDNHQKAFQFAKEHGIHRTAHAGEACGPESVRETLELLKPTRIGHGVRSMEDKELLSCLKESNIHLEVCPTSNIQTDVYPTYNDHSIHQLYEEGISLSINTDGRTTSNVSLSDEYQKLHNTFGWDVQQFLRCNQNAVRAAFLSDEGKKDQLKKVLEESYR